MTDTPSTPDATPGSLAGDSVPTPEPTQDDPGREAAKYRVRLRETEAERDQMANRLTAALERIVTTEAAKHFADPADLWTVAKLPDLVNESYGIDTEKLDAVIDAALTAKPHWKRPAPATESISTVRSNDRVEAGKAEPTFADAFRPPNQRNR